MKSTDAGKTWARITEQVTYPGTHITAIVPHRKSTTDLCIGADDGYIFKSTTGGSSWIPGRRSQERDGILSIGADPADPELLYAGSGSGTLVSVDFGTSWQPLSLTLPRCATSLVVSTNRQQPGLYAFGQGIGLQFSSDVGKTWVHADQGLGGSSVSVLIAHRTGSDLYAIVGQAVCKYDAQKRSWQSAANGLTGGTISSIAFDPDSSSIVYVGTLNGIFQSSNAGALWQPISPSLRFNPITFVDAHPSIRTRLLISTEQGIQISTDMGISWMRTQPTDTKFQLRALTFSPADAGRIYGITVDEDIITTLDGGFTWNTPARSIPASGFEALTLDQGNDRISYAWTNHGDGFQSIDEGNLWRAFDVPWKRGDTVRFAVNREKPSEVVAIVNSGKIFYSSKGGATWTEIPVTTPPDELCSLFWNGPTSTLYAGTRSSGVYQVSLKATLERVIPK
jgi:photosystem II stability/assembly factor-like uncharacterized protein